MQKTALHSFHVDNGAKMVDFVGWDMPLHYGSIIEEHQAVRQSGGLFDVSHMGRLRFSGDDARRFLERVLTRRVSDMAVGACRYSCVCNEQGGVKDDILIYRDEKDWLMIVNASNREKLIEHFAVHQSDLSVKMKDETTKTVMVALQGPKVIEAISAFAPEVATLKRYHFIKKNLMIANVIISRTGYTGEDGVEVILPNMVAAMALKKLTGSEEVPVVPAGLGSRDTLRLEAGMPLYGHELGETIDPLTAGLKFAVALDKDEDTQWGPAESFIGQAALKQLAADGTPKKLVGLEISGRRTPRQGAEVIVNEQTIGEVTSGCFSPTLDRPIAMALVETSHSEVGGTVEVNVGRSTCTATIVALPFYKASKK